MPLDLPNLDDRTYDDLMQEALSLLPIYAPDWTNHNPSDPGITLIELFAYLTEMLLYRQNQVTNANRQAFLNLISGLESNEQKKFPQPLPETALNEAIREAIQRLRQSDRAVTSQDFEALAKQASPQVARTHCVPRRNLISDNPLAPEPKPGHVSIVIVPQSSSPSDELLQTVADYLEPRRLLTTKVHVVAPRYVAFRIQIAVMVKPDARPAAVQQAAVQRLVDFFHPLKGGDAGSGWPFGRSIYVSEVYEQLDNVSGVDYVLRSQPGPEVPPLEEIVPLSSADAHRRRLNRSDQLVALALDTHELPSLQPDLVDITVRSPLRTSTLLTDGNTR